MLARAICQFFLTAVRPNSSSALQHYGLTAAARTGQGLGGSSLDLVCRCYLGKGPLKNIMTFHTVERGV